jgi:hypothetical protein
MIKVTYAYGTTRKAKVLKTNWRPKGLPDKAPSGMLLVDEFKEGHVCVGECGDMTAKEGDTGTLTFTKGGPTGGYWKFTKDK